MVSRRISYSLLRLVHGISIVVHEKYFRTFGNQGDYPGTSRAQACVLYEFWSWTQLCWKLGIAKLPSNWASGVGDDVWAGSRRCMLLPLGLLTLQRIPVEHCPTYMDLAGRFDMRIALFLCLLFPLMQSNTPRLWHASNARS